ncbi:uncharacterized protein K460DRAFT_390981 [Cucurbitaria berberidis CBS 394.84]|uniref:Uncharacterized protein n=1 Tax=Cucurbitaria berberidis CBS 394.84 TaxID=1168544 RepID=A0A9P4GS26_9PLEO|nr:uncharacterized protein K460DRAFT_390981 [Cucurbitaria berberidis CBS 394.84]KAF1850484.1 hypothetical protein K460DRAFT_390981 [Cucurbitaria berberidis CBS 394.84]
MNHLDGIIDFGPRGHIRVDVEAFLSWFPTIRRHHFPIDGLSLVNKLQARLQSHYNITRTEILQTLYTLCDHLQYHPLPFQGETRVRVTAALTHLLREDIEINGFNNRGLYRLRHSFVILAYLANDCVSTLLAGALFDFWYGCEQYIQLSDAHYLHKEWIPAVRKIEEVGADGMVHGAGHMDFGALATRGRIPHRLMGLPWPDNRALSAPVTRRRRSPDMQMALAPFPNSAWTSPMISPAGFPRTQYFDEIDGLQYQQREMNMKLENIDHKLDFLVGNF